MTSRFRFLSILVALAIALLATPALAQNTGTSNQEPWSDVTHQQPPCCDPTEEPNITGQQACAAGYVCCGDGSWRCNDVDGVSTCSSADAGQVCEIACCDPFGEPGAYGNPLCFEGHSCCGDGEWRCNAGDGSSTCVAQSAACPDCCDPDAMPANCIEGASCCGSGEWRCNEGDGSSTCPVDGVVCPERCCDPADDPNGDPTGGTPGCIEGSTCCATGRYECNAGDGSSTCAQDGVVCPGCCDPLDRPGSFGNAACIEGTTCCADGSWQCNDATGQSSCQLDGVPCDLTCCDPALEPDPANCPNATCCADGSWQCSTPGGPQCQEGVSCEVQCCDPAAEPSCIEGATCCSDGDWRCNQGNGQSSCPVDGDACRFCCDPTEEPGVGDNPICFEGATCCSDGGWQCNAGDGSSTCSVDGLTCLDCCDPLEEPGRFGNPFCVEGATCCGDGTWRCNQGNGTPSCDLVGDACDPPCCDRDERPNDPGNPFCATGFECCGDGDWQCNDAEGNPTCPYDEFGEECPVRCGGIAGLPCDGDEFCKTGPGECCCDFMGVCTEIPQGCPDVWDPVCGCDGVTYGNECEAEAAGVSVDFPGECRRTCGGIAGDECLEGEYCLYPDGECCCDVVGVCEPIPQACPDVCDPVCGCDGESYTNRCEAAAAGASVLHPGACNEGGGLVSGVHFDEGGNLGWKPTPGAVAYNVYRQRHQPTPSPPQEGWTCYAPNVTTLRVPVPGDPALRVAWWFQVAAVFEDGSEGPLGLLQDCSRRVPAVSCQGSVGTGP